MPVVVGTEKPREPAWADWLAVGDITVTASLRIAQNSGLRYKNSINWPCCPRPATSIH